jgi:hypothetical protein
MAEYQVIYIKMDYFLFFLLFPLWIYDLLTIIVENYLIVFK